MGRAKDVGQFMRFGVVGAGNTLVDFAVLNLLVWLFQAPQGGRLLLCNVVGFACANLNSYFLNKRWTFSDRQDASLGQYGTFLWVSLIGLTINTFFLWLFGDFLAPARWAGHLGWVNFAKLIASAASMLWNFLAYRRLVFRDHSMSRSFSKMEDCHVEKK